MGLEKVVHDISPVFHQYNCGCCCKHGVVQTMNDNFVAGQTTYPTTNDDTNDGLAMNPNMNVTTVLGTKTMETE